MRKEVILITGANGEIGHGLITHLGSNGKKNILAMDIHPLDDCLVPFCSQFIQGDVTDANLIQNLGNDFEIQSIFHLASLLSTKAEHNPELAHHVNVDGTLNLLKLAAEESARQQRSVKFIYPSSIAAYGFPNVKSKISAGCVAEDGWLHPITMYGCNKLYCENLGKYYANHYRLLAPQRSSHSVDFRCLRFPGLISAITLPTGGTSDYGPEMLHHAAQGKPYACFVREDSILPFMVMADAVKSLLLLESALKEKLSQSVYNVTSFSVTAQEIYDVVIRAFPGVQITFEPHQARQSIVDSWPASVDDSAAQRDWGWSPDYNFERSFEEYLIPAVRARYHKS